MKLQFWTLQKIIIFQKMSKMQKAWSLVPNQVNTKRRAMDIKIKATTSKIRSLKSIAIILEQREIGGQAVCKRTRIYNCVNHWINSNGVKPKYFNLE